MTELFKTYVHKFSAFLQIMARLLINFFSSLQYILKSNIFFPNLVSYANNLVSSVTLPTIVIAIAIGVVIGVQLGPQFVSRGVGSKLGILTILTMSRELVPILGGFMIATQYGTALTAEIANMKITEQLDALKIFKVSPVFYIVSPALLAGVIISPLLFWLAVLFGTLSTYLTVTVNEDLSWNSYLSSIVDYYKLDDFYLCISKASVFALIIVVIASTIGLSVGKGGAREVGRATTVTVISCFIAVIITDLIMTMFYLDL